MDEFVGEPAPIGATDAPSSAEPVDLDHVADRPPLRIEYAEDFEVQSSMPLVDGWIDQGELVAMIGAPGSFKTTLAADMACSVAHGLEWMGCKTEPGAVMMIELEGARGFRHRTIAWHRSRDLDMRNAPLAMISQNVTLAEGCDGEDTQRIIKAAQAVEEKTGLPVRLIAIDTLARSMGSLDEDKASDIAVIVQAAAEIQRHTGAAVLIIHHTGLSDGTRGRGSSNQRASWDVELIVEANGAYGTIKAAKQREKEQLAPLTFATTVVEIGSREDGKPVTARVARKAEEGEIPDPKAKASGLKLGKNERKLPLAMTEARDSLQPLPKGPAFPPSGFGMTEDDLRPLFNAKLDSDMTPGSRRSAFKRAKEGLIEADMMAMDSGWVWLTDQPSSEFEAEEAGAE